MVIRFTNCVWGLKFGDQGLCFMVLDLIRVQAYAFGSDKGADLSFGFEKGIGFDLGSLRLSHLLHFLCHLIGVWGGV